MFYIIGDSIFNRVSPPTAIEGEDEELDTSLDPEADEVEYSHQQQPPQVLTLHTDSVTKKPQTSSTASIINISSAHSTPQTSMTSLPTAEPSISGSLASGSMSLGSFSAFDEDATPEEELGSKEEDRPKPGLGLRVS
jgi:hypothetical protein